MIYLKHIVAIILLVPLGFIGTAVKWLAFTILNFFNFFLNLINFTVPVTFYSQVWELVISASISEGVFTFTVIFLNYILIKKLFKWNISFKPFLIVFALLILGGTVNDFFTSLEVPIFENVNLSRYEQYVLFGGLWIGFIFTIIASFYPILIAYSEIDENGNWSN